MIETLKNPPINKTRQNLKKLHINKKKDNTKSSRKYFLKNIKFF